MKQTQKDIHLAILLNINQISRGHFALFIGGRGHNHGVMTIQRQPCPQRDSKLQIALFK